MDYDKNGNVIVTDEQYALAVSRGISRANVNNRLNHLLTDWTIDEAIRVPIKSKQIKEEEYVFKAIENGISLNNYRYRRRIGWSKERASTKEAIKRVSSVK